MLQMAMEVELAKHNIRTTNPKHFLLTPFLIPSHLKFCFLVYNNILLKFDHFRKKAREK